MKKRSVTVWILGDQLSPRASSLIETNRNDAVVLMAESLARASQMPYHKQKLVLVWSAMRHFAEELRAAGYEVDYYPHASNMKRALRAHRKKYGTGAASGHGKRRIRRE